ncbi:sodium-dependent transporter [Oscillibacter valericigenes]|uniref:sodium-dependent transporter n=1 Tax=Oscillibacter valericigenes TaxID=351091 RepID=UPI001F19AACD|nr:sodium-dependent transporter [Oscillibacter valericigenes]MCF2664649.1 sodium-dependent transporter [Oscillibacter valericigenes]
MKRESFQSRLGFILVSAGCAIGIGNVWKFPYVTGQNGGGVFVLFYLLFLAIMGVPILTMELAVGRSSRKSVIQAFHTLEPKGSKWHIHGWVAIAGNYILLMYYTTVCGWMFGYFFKFLAGTFTGLDSTAISGVFSAMLASPLELLGWMALSLVLGTLVCSMGLQNGLERITKVMMLGLLGLIVVLAVHSLTLEGALEGVKFYLLPDFGRAMENGLSNVIVAAMNQAFFTLSLGMAGMQIFGSYMSKDNTLTSESIRICLLDTFVALMAGLIIFPACFSFDVEPSAGPPLIFETLPNIFANMPGGRIWGALFFLFMTFASFSTVTAVFENLLASCCDNFGWSRKKSALLNGLFLLAAGIPCVLGHNVWSGVTLIRGMGIMDTEDFLVSNLILPGGSLVFLLFCVTRYGWGFDKYLEEANTGTGIRMSRKLKPFFQFILPILILVILIRGLI